VGSIRGASFLAPFADRRLNGPFAHLEELSRLGDDLLAQPAALFFGDVDEFGDRNVSRPFKAWPANLFSMNVGA
jgi:hypothetical protein